MTGLGTNAVEHPLTGARYEPAGPGRVRVTEDGMSGLFDNSGRWLEGDLEEADPQMCRWVGGTKPEDRPDRGARGSAQAR